MSALPVETTESDPAATSLADGEAVNKETGDSSAPTDKEAIVDESKGDAAEETVEETEAVDVKDNGDSAVKDKSEQKENGDSVQNGKKGNGSPAKFRKDPEGMLKTRVKQADGKNNSRYDPSVLPETDDPQKIRAQVEFYFGDHNLPSDKFMWELTDGTSNLPISIEKICTFGRMKRFRPISAVVAALKESNFLDVIGEDGKEQVKRKIAYDPNIPRSRVESRTIYVKGFGDEERSSQFDIEAFFAPYGPTNAVRLRRTEDKLFKGSVFVEFQDDETAQKFLDLDPKPKWKGEHVLKVMSKKEYMDLKDQEIKDGKIEPQNGNYSRDGKPIWRGRGGYRGNNRGGNRNERDRGSRDGGDRDPDDWKKRREDDRANGFKNDRHRDDHKKGGGRGRGRGRGDRDRGHRNHDRNRDRDDKRDEKSEGSPVNEKKRAREDDGGSEKPSKKVDSKPELAVEAS